jgi:prepilin-type N-terminal cleavage/methylation domain-containing protein
MRFRIRNRGQARGFSLVEIIVVLAIILCISGYAIPNFMVAVANIRLRGGMSTLSSLIQNCRMTAIKNNRNYSVHFAVMANGPVAFIKDSTAGTTISNTDPQAQLGAPVSMNQSPSGPGAPTILLDNSILLFDPSTADPAFNSRGMPCLYASGNCTTPKGFVFYITDSRPIGRSGWGAVSISPAGHVRTWMWDGTRWGN